MAYDKALIAAKLRRWEKYLGSYRLPQWEEIPNFGLYMEQVITLLTEYLDYMPPELKEDEQIITAAAVNNYVRRQLMPLPVKKRYYRIHIAYLLVICSLKQGMNIAAIHELLPANLPEAQVQEIYTTYVDRFRRTTDHFIAHVRMAAAGILGHEAESDISTDNTEALIVSYAVLANFSRLLAEKLMRLDGTNLEEAPPAPEA